MQFELYNAIQFYRELTTGHNTYFIFLTWLQIVIFYYVFIVYLLMIFEIKDLKISRRKVSLVEKCIIRKKWKI